jgi:predicted acylesterase/phospholipase RssA
MSPEPEPDISLAFSGGGKRAALFSLGAALALVEGGKNKNLATVSSVSGGSITNAAIAQRIRLERATVSEIRGLCRDLGHELVARRHRITVPTILAVMMVTIWALELSPFGLAVTRLIDDFLQSSLFTGLGLTPGSRAAVVVATHVFGVLSAMLAGLSLRTYLQTEMLARLFWRPNATRNERHGTIGELGERTVKHALCLTDLETAQPLFVVNDQIHAMDGLMRTDGTLRLADVVSGSAAFPGAFLPVILKYQASPHGEPPRRAVVTDGGVHNNLGTDWVLADTIHSSIDWQVPPASRAAHVFVLDASAPPLAVTIHTRRIDRLAGMFPFGAIIEMLFLRRTMNVIYESGLAVRQTLLAIGDSISTTGESVSYLPITASPLDYARSVRGAHDQTFSDRAVLAVEQLEDFLPVEEWDRMREITCAMKTDLARVEAATGRNVVLHGYYAMRVALYVRFGVPIEAAPQLDGPPSRRRPDRRFSLARRVWFEEFGDTSRKNESNFGSGGSGI